MANAPPYAQFLFNLSALKKEVGDTAFEGCDEVLAYLAVRESEGKLVKITELVQSLQFGTGPTVHRKILVLEAVHYSFLKSRCFRAKIQNVSIDPPPPPPTLF